MEAVTFKMHRRAQMALYELSPEEQTLIRQRAAALAAAPTGRWSEFKAIRNATDPSCYLVPVDDTWRLIVRTADGEQPEVQDIVSQARLDAFQTVTAKPDN